MMKRFLVKILIVICALTFSLGVMTACGGEGETPTHTHDYNTLKHDAQNHWYECSCGEKQNVEAHSGGTATCKEKASCDICSEKHGELSECNFVNKVCTVCGNKQASEGLSFESITIDGVDGYSVTGLGTCTDTTVVIPSAYENAPVISIGNNAFKGYFLLESVVIGDNVTTIGDYAFSQCSLLESVAIGDNVTTIGESAFEYCNSLTSIEIKEKVERIAFGVFDGCPALTIYCEAESVPSDWDSDWNYALYPVVWDSNNNDVANDGCIYAVIDSVRYSLKSYSVTDHIATVVKQPLSIVNANMPDEVTYKGVNYKVTKIIDEAFYNCDLLKKAVIGDNVLEVGASAFAQCDAVESIVIGFKVDIVGVHAFYNCGSLHIYSRQKIKPTNWYNGWNASNCPVSWGSGS